MKPVQILMDDALLAEIDAEAKRTRADRSKIMRAAVRRYLQEARIRAWEQADADAYRKRPLSRDELEPWQRARLWPED